MELVKGKKYGVFSIRRTKQGAVWTRAGSAFMNRDGSINVYLNVLPLDGALHIREAAPNPLEPADRKLPEEE